MTIAFAASRTFRKSTYSNWLPFYHEGDDNISGYVVEPPGILALLIRVDECSKGPPEPICGSFGHDGHEWGLICTGPALPRLLVCLNI